MGALRDRSKTKPAKLRAPAQRVPTDPRCEPADPCACGKQRPRIAVLNADPFCSTVCCRLYYGCEL